MKFVIILIGSLIVFLGVSVGYVYEVNHINAYIDSIETSATNAETLTQRDARLRTMEVFLSDTVSERAELERFIVRDDSVVSVIELIEVVAGNTGVDLSVSGVTILNQDGWNAHEAVELTFSASGSFRDMQRFIVSLESLPLASQVHDVNLEIGTGSSWFGTFRVLFLKEKL